MYSTPKGAHGPNCPRKWLPGGRFSHGQGLTQTMGPGPHLDNSFKPDSTGSALPVTPYLAQVQKTSHLQETVTAWDVLRSLLHFCLSLHFSPMMSCF